jgi:hypothetical protein
VKRSLRPASVPDLGPEDWRDLRWLLRVLEGWLLVAEPSTIRELDRYLLSVGSDVRTPTVQRRLGEVQQRLQRLRVQ